MGIPIFSGVLLCRKSLVQLESDYPCLIQTFNTTDIPVKINFSRGHKFVNFAKFEPFCWSEPHQTSQTPCENFALALIEVRRRQGWRPLDGPCWP